MTRHRLLAPALVVGALATTGCTGDPCTDQYEPRGLILELSSGTHAGAYQVQIAAENKLVLVDYTIDSSGNATCAGNCRDRSDPLMIESDYPSFQEPDHTVRLRVSRTRNPKWGPELLNLRIARDQLVLLDREYTPAYQYSEPFGEGCGEIAVSTISLDLTQ